MNDAASGAHDAPDPSAIGRLYDHYVGSLGHYSGTRTAVPDPVVSMGAFGEKWAEGFLSIRETIFEDREDGLSFGMKSLLFCVLALTGGHTDGAIQHGRNALSNGVSKNAMMEAMMQVKLVNGIQNWGVHGYRVVRELGLIPDEVLDMAAARSDDGTA